MANIAEICSHWFYIKLCSCCVRLFLSLVIKCLKITHISFDHVLALWSIPNKGHLMNTESSSCLIELVRQLPEYCRASMYVQCDRPCSKFLHWTGHHNVCRKCVTRVYSDIMIRPSLYQSMGRFQLEFCAWVLQPFTIKYSALRQASKSDELV
jgi:hypothetical protein